MIRETLRAAVMPWRAARRIRELREALGDSVRVIAAVAAEFPELTNGAVTSRKRHLRAVDGGAR